jgi:drug/metabolite transporter superfamily protein YnfA
MNDIIQPSKDLERLVSRSNPNSAGAATRDVSTLAQAERLKVLCDFLISSLEPLRGELDGLLSVVLAMMKRVRRITLIGAVIAALSGLVMAISTAFHFEAEWQKVVTAGFAAFGGLVVVLSDYFQMAPNGRKIASSEEYGKLAQMASELLLIERRASQHALFPLSEQEIKQMLDQTNGYAAHINSLKVR